MYYGTEKTRQMARSILPSKSARKAKSEKDKLHRVNRRHNTVHLTSYRGVASDVCEDFEDDTDDLTRWVEPHRAGRWGGDIVQERRDADKINHFIRWAKKVSADVRDEDKLSKVAALLPEGPIGDHAVTHLDELDYRRDNSWRYYRRRGDGGYQERVDRYHIELEAAVNKIAHNKAKRDKMNEWFDERFGYLRREFIREATAPRYGYINGKYEWHTPPVPKTTPYDVYPQMKGYHRRAFFLSFFKIGRSPKYRWIYRRNEGCVAAACEYFGLDNPLD